ncbi:hypothetical protein ACK11Z_09220 [Methanoculleus bourgensis]|uniref:hypothetical protein n=1 Tax=Methanoculleus bourgensis TaxID=83986 RepID=UPI003B96679A
MIPRPVAIRPEEDYPGVYDLNRRGFSCDDDLAPEGLHRAAVYLMGFEPGSGNPEE